MKDPGVKERRPWPFKRLVCSEQSPVRDERPLLLRRDRRIPSPESSCADDTRVCVLVSVPNLPFRPFPLVLRRSSTSVTNGNFCRRSGIHRPNITLWNFHDKSTDFLRSALVLRS